MGSPTFGMLPGNNAPPPPVYAGNNPTGGGGLFNTNRSTGSSGPNSNFPNFPLFGSMSNGVVSPMANMPLFGGSSMAGLSSGMKFPGWGNDPSGHLLNELGSAYGKGAGSYIDQLLMKGMFNPQVASAYLNAMQPGINRGEQDILNSFGSEGARFSSAAALGQGNFLSQANLNEQQTLASMFMNAQQQQLGLLENVLPTLHAEQANKGGLWQDILGGLEIAGGLVAAPFTGGLSLGLVGSGIGTLAGGLDGGGSSGNGSSLGIPSPMQMTGTPSFFPSTSGQGLTATAPNFWQQLQQYQLGASGGNALNNGIGDTSGNDDLSAFFMGGN